MIHLQLIHLETLPPMPCPPACLFTGRVKRFPGQTELTMSAEVELIQTMVDRKAGTRPPIQMEFQVCVGGGRVTEVSL